MSKLNETHTRLKTARIAAGYRTATNFCEKNHVPISTYNMHETGKRKFSADIAENYASILNINAAWLITGEGNPYPGSLNEPDSNLTEAEYLKLLNYSGNYKIPVTPPTPLISQPINAVLFCKIFNEIVQALNEFNTSLDIKYACHYATEIYEDILETSQVYEDQLTMLNLAITIFRKKIQQSAQEPLPSPN
ncbi:MAG: helix-turn-helix transcriptional regulator [Legionellaceae bacterium]|nr:helix-turn-helix transcriptional regulator [Legionellaceae bacterium]